MVHFSQNHRETTQKAKECFEDISESLARGEFVVALFSYELGRLFHGLETKPNSHPIIQAWSFSSYDQLSKKELDIWIEETINQSSEHGSVCGVAQIKNSISEKEFFSDIKTIQDYILNGETYQINHTYRVIGKAYGLPLALYSRLRGRQPGRYGAFIESVDDYILSFSPELFIQKKGNFIKAMPMKGTASALEDSANDLKHDPKNRSENVMIVDLLRNDLGRLAQIGTVKVPKLFDVAKYGEVLQMTSTIEAKCKPNLSLYEIFQAIFPCGSVTGAPKKRSMEIIQELESSDRGYYCGALGWFDPNGDFTCSVPIRTAELSYNKKSKASSFVLGIGAGVTIESSPEKEWEECQLKSSFLTSLPSQVGIFETILVKEGIPVFLGNHLQRMDLSSKELLIPFNIEDAEKKVLMAAQKLDRSLTYRLKLDLSSKGDLSVVCKELDSVSSKVKLFWAKDILHSEDVTMHSGDMLLKHKTNSRALYDLAWQAASSRGGFDALFTNEKGLVTEGGRTNVFIKPQNSTFWLTPPVSAGLLPGLMRQRVLNDSLWNSREQNLTIEDVMAAEKIVLTNSLRGVMPCHF
jgi:para-aminobenzoate synthetase/4-amino-4-deoxychorismate lyase